MKEPLSEHDHFYVIGKRHWLLIEYTKLAFLSICTLLFLVAVIIGWHGMQKLQDGTKYQKEAYERNATAGRKP